ncbi:MAG TPA: DUF3073 domain-containing protein [Pilimelia sp.]|nr:DUF3073 domain-containing protein [Pilimelia sp.]
MGRGRAKAKQTKVARELKYNTPNTDLAALQRELASGSHKPAGDFDQPDPYLDDSDDDEDDEDPADDPPRWASRSG